MSSWWRRAEPLIPLTSALDALGDEGVTSRYTDEVLLDRVVGSVARFEDFDARFKPLRRTDRMTGVRRRFAAGNHPPPIDLVQLGDLYFVVDGHHRVAVAREQGWTTLPARVRRICTVAFARCCLRVADLPAKAAERRFLELVPLPDDVRTDLWLDRPADWAQLEEAALAWGHQREQADGTRYCCAHDLAAAWWAGEVLPAVRRLRRRAEAEGQARRIVDLTDVQVFVTALAERDGLGGLDWADPANDEVACCALGPASA